LQALFEGGPDAIEVDRRDAQQSETPVMLPPVADNARNLTDSAAMVRMCADSG